jgi:hypothetical protein
LYLRIAGIYTLKEERVNDDIVRADYKYIGLYLSWRKKKSGLGGVRETYMKTDFGLEPNAYRAG